MGSLCGWKHGLLSRVQDKVLRGEYNMLNLIAFIVCIVGAIWHIAAGNTIWVIIEFIFAFVNLPFVIEYLYLGDN
jgi:hypothetical protein